MFRLNHTFAHTALFKNKVLLIMLFLAGLSLSLFTLISGAVYAQGLENDPSSEDDSSDEVVITIKVDGFDESIPSLSSKNQDFVIGQPVKANPIYYQDENGETPLADLVESKEAEGYQLFWHDESGAVFDWFSTPVTKSQTITGSFVEGLNQVRIVFGDDKNTPDLIVEVSSGKSFSDAYENTLPTPVKAGYTFSEWINSKTNEPFDFDAPISSSTTVIATYKLTDATQTSTIDPTQDIPKTLTGTCYIGATWSVHPALFNVSNFSGGLKGCAGVGTCSLPSAAAPSYTTATYTATLKSVDVKAGKIVYSCHIVPPGAARPGGPSNSLGLIGYQTVAMECVVEKSFGGYVDIKKVSANPSLSNNNDRYSLENACFEIYNEKNQAVATLYTNEQGKTDKSPLLPSGTYTIVETQAPDGYARAESKTVTINPGETKTVTFEDYPLNNVVDLAVEKLDKELQTNTPLGNASLAGAEFTLSYYDRYLYSETDVNSAGSPERVWTIKTDEEGKAYLDEDHLVTGSPFYRDSQGTITLPLGTLVIKETKASPGYLCSDEVFIQHITTPVTPVLNSLSSSIGSLFSSKTNSSDEHITVFTPITCNEQVIRGDIAFSKIADSDATRLSTIPFRITSLTTGESHIVLTDENGMANTDNAWNKHSHNTNKGETCRDGIWFGQDKNNQFTAQVSNELGALPYDSYLVEELPCDANQQFNLISFTVTITRDGLTLDLGTIDNQEKPQVIIHKIDSTQENSEENLAGASLVLEIKE
ncbi:MAG: collagen binding domain-containing protein, partial [Anaerotardibacter sp.]